METLEGSIVSINGSTSFCGVIIIHESIRKLNNLTFLCPSQNWLVNLRKFMGKEMPGLHWELSYPRASQHQAVEQAIFVFIATHCARADLDTTDHPLGAIVGPRHIGLPIKDAIG